MADNGWGSLRLGDICTKIGSGATPRGGKEVYLRDGPYALIRSQNVHNDQFHHDQAIRKYRTQRRCSALASLA